MTFSRLSIVLWALSLPCLFLLYRTVPPSPDQSLFDYIAWSHIQGDYYYTGMVEQNWPGKMFLHELGIRLFGVHPWTFRAIDFCLMQLCTLGGVLFLRRAGFVTGGWVFLLLYPALYVTAGEWMAGQRDIIAMGLFVTASALILRPASGPAPGVLSLGGAGVLSIFAVLLRPTYLTFAALVFLIELARMFGKHQTGGDVFRRLLFMLLGFALPLGLVVYLGHRIGALDDFYQQTILFNVESYQVQHSRFLLIEPMLMLLARSWHWITLLGAIGGLLWVTTRGVSHALALWVGLLVTVLVSYFVQNKGFGYHLGGVLTLLCFLIGITFDRAAHAYRTATNSGFRVLVGGAAALALLLTLAGTAKKIWGTAPQDWQSLVTGQSSDAPLARCPAPDQVQQVVELIRQDSSPDAHILQWGRHFQIPYLAERRSTLRFVSTPALELMTPSFSGYEPWLAEITRDLEAKRPRFVVISTDNLPSDPEAPVEPRADASAAERLVVAHLAEYEPVLRLACLAVYRDR